MSLETDLEATETALRADLTAKVAALQAIFDEERAYQRSLKQTATSGPNGTPDVGLYYSLVEARAPGNVDRMIATGNARVALKAARDAMNAADANRWKLLGEGNQINRPLAPLADPVELITIEQARNSEGTVSDFAPDIRTTPFHDKAWSIGR